MYVAYLIYANIDEVDAHCGNYARTTFRKHYCYIRTAPMEINDSVWMIPGTVDPIEEEKWR